MAKRKINKGGEVRLVAYYRYSGGSGQTEQSIEGQRRDCETYARLHNMTIQKNMWIAISAARPMIVQHSNK